MTRGQCHRTIKSCVTSQSRTLEHALEISHRDRVDQHPADASRSGAFFDRGLAYPW